MSKMEQISAERRREENIKKSMEFQMQIGLTRIAENDVVSLPEKKFRQEYVKRKNIEATSRRSKRIEKCCSIASCIEYFGLFCALLYTLLHCAYPSMTLYVSLDCSVDGVSPPSGAIRNRRSIL